MPKIYYSGLSSSRDIFKSLSNDFGSVIAIDHFTPALDDNVSDIEIGWDYFLLWKNNQLYMSGKITDNKSTESCRLLEIPDHTDLKLKQAIAGSDKVTVLTENSDIWIYNIYEDEWKKVPKFISSLDEDENEFVVKIAQGRCTVALTNLGHVFNIPVSLSKVESVKFVDVACGYDHTLLLAENGDIYSAGMGTRGQLGHGDLEDCDEPKLIEALAGLKVVKISAYGWHSAVVTDQGDLYTWGWNNQGQLGLPKVQNVVAVPTIVEFSNEAQKSIELNLIQVECGTTFTICRTDSGKFWGCGSNKYGQLGHPRKKFISFKQFVPLKFNNIKEQIKDFKCREWGTCIYVT